VTAFAAIVSRRATVERDDYGRVAAALTAVYGTQCDAAAFDGCILLAAPMVSGEDDHLFADTVAGFAATGHVLLEDRRSLSAALGHSRQIPSIRLVAETYRCRGDGCTGVFTGEFALAIWNDREKTLLCARDGLGLRPLFIATAPDLIVVSNVLTAARAHGRVSRALDLSALAQFLVTGGIPASRTAYRAVVPLPPGHTLIVHGSGSSSLRRHWLFPVADREVVRDGREVVEGYRSVVQAAVDERLAPRASVLMSGGIDSTSIAAAARATAPDVDLHAFTAVYQRATTESELPRARLVANVLEMPITPVCADSSPALHHLTHEATTPQPLDEPTLADWRTLVGAAAHHSPVALYGEDGDSLFLPPRWKAMRRRQSRTELFAAGLRFTVSSRRLPYFGMRLRERLGLSGRPGNLPHPHWLTPDAVGLATDGEARVLGHAAIPLPPHPDRPEVQARLSAGVAGYLSGILTPEVTGHRIELRCPLLDSRVIRFVVNTAPIPWCQDKHLPRLAYADALPHAVVHYPKQGVGGVEAALSADWQARSRDMTGRRDLPPEIAEWLRVDDWRRALESPDPRRVGEAWRVLQLAAWMAAQANVSRPSIPDPRRLCDVGLKNRPCTA
jgi:asparagine synthase (glutamine-hydrolysing)